jgi:rare lipoprotein A (peptidoglycan hydrolase)
MALAVLLASLVTGGGGLGPAPPPILPAPPRPQRERIARYQSALASWYYDAGSTACGFHATYGFASRTLACGTRLVMRHAGRTVVATVEDRGPFVYSRLFDLNPALRRVLACPDLCLVQYALR